MFIKYPGIQLICSLPSIGFDAEKFKSRYCVNLLIFGHYATCRVKQNYHFRRVAFHFYCHEKKIADYTTRSNYVAV